MACSNERIFSAKKNINYETYSLIWLDSQRNADDVHEKLRSSINYLRTFDRINECETYIQSISSEDRIVLIVSDHFAQQLIPNIHCFRKVSSIYILCKNKQFDQQWSKQYRKVNLVFE